MSSMTKVAIMLAVKQDLSIRPRSHYTISELTHSVQVSRSTLYYHFRGGLPEAFTFTFQQEIILPIRSEKLDWPAATQFLLVYVADHQTLVKNMYQLSDANQTFVVIQQALMQAMAANYQQLLPWADMPILTRQLQVLSAALLFELQLWLLNNCTEDWHVIQQRLAVFDRQLDN